MSFRIRLILSFAAAVIVTAALVTFIVSRRTGRAFEQRDDQRTAIQVAQFRREFDRRGEAILSVIDRIASAEGTLRIAIDADPSQHVNHAASLAAEHELDFLELVSADGSIVSSAQRPARFGYREPWLISGVDWKAAKPFLKSEELPDETALALVAVRVVEAGERKLYVVGGRRLDRRFLESLVLPEGMRALLYRPPASVTGAAGPIGDVSRIMPLIERVRASGLEASQRVAWPDGPETLQAIPLTGRDRELLGVLLIGSSRRDLAALVAGIRRTGFAAAGIGILLGAALSFWITMRITRPVEVLARGARQVAAGDWDARVEVPTRDELGQLAGAFNTMTAELINQRDRLVQAERVAAWRELARRLAHELKNPLFPLQITIENLQRAKECAPAEFDEVFRESTGTLLAELENLKRIVARFSDFAKMPAPRIERVDLDEVVLRSVRLFEPQLRAAGRPAIALETELGRVGLVPADPDLLGRALQNLVLNAIDAMPSGGTLRISTSRINGHVAIELSDTGQGLMPEECERLFTPYYTTKQHGTGLGLAIVQSIVADHHGRISVASEPGRGATFRIELPGEEASA